MVAYAVVKYNFRQPKWYIEYKGVLDGSGLPKIAGGPFNTEEEATKAAKDKAAWECSLDNPARWE